MRSQWLATRTARLNAMRGFLREFGVNVPAGSKLLMNNLHRLLRDPQDRLPPRVRRAVVALWDEVRGLENKIEAVESELEQIARNEPVFRALRDVPGTGTLTATALFATVADVHAFRNGRGYTTAADSLSLERYRKQLTLTWKESIYDFVRRCALF